MGLPIGSTLGSYRIDALIGYGGMGEVYRASHTAIERTAAIKLLVNLSSERRLIDRFRNEARIHARLSHPGIATLYDFCDTASGPAIVMEYVEGRTIDDEIRRSGRFTWPRATAVLSDLAEAVGYLHLNGIVHRDIKANNVKVTPMGRAKLLDFGIAKDVRSPKLTVADNVIGTIQYMAPEQLAGKPASAASDVWALGVLFYEMLTGRQPFTEASISKLLKQIGGAEFRPVAEVAPNIPQPCLEIVARCLQREPQARYQNAGALLSALVAAQLSGRDAISLRSARRSIGPPAWLSPAPAIGWLRRNHLIVGAGAGAAVACLLVILLTFGGSQTASTTPAASSPAGGRQVPVRIDSFTPGASIEITQIDGGRVARPSPFAGSAPFVFAAPVGAEVRFTVRRRSREPIERKIVVLENSNDYTY